MKKIVLSTLLSLAMIASPMANAATKIITQPASNKAMPGSPLGGASLASFGIAIQGIQKKVSAQTKPPLSTSRKMVIVTAVVANNGKLLNAKVKRSSGNPKLDAQALATVKSAAPFAPLPKGFTGKSMSLDLSLP